MRHFLTFKHYPDVVVTEAQYQRFVDLISQNPEMVADVIEWNRELEIARARDDEFGEIPAPKFRRENSALFEREIQKFPSPHLLITAVSRSLHRYRKEISQ